MSEGDDFEQEPLSVYFVRIAKDHQVVGVFAAHSVEQLADLVDEAVTPQATEYLIAGAGGLYVGGRTSAQFPARQVLDESGQPVDIMEEDAAPFDGASLGDFWWRDMDEGEWFPLAWDTAPKPSTPRRTRRPSNQDPTRSRHSNKFRRA